MEETPTPSPHKHVLRDSLGNINNKSRPAVATVHSAPSSLDGSIFDPENEAVLSTCQLEIASRQLARLRTGPTRFTRPSRTQSDNAIGATAAAPNLFPASSEHDDTVDDTTASIEIGRGLKKSVASAHSRFSHRDFSANLLKGLDDASRLSFNDLMDTPEGTRLVPVSSNKAPHQHGLTKSNPQDDLFGLENKENKQPASGDSKAADYGSGQGSQGNERLHSVAAGHSNRPNTQDNRSGFNNERDPAQDLTSRSTRFHRTKGGVAPVPATLKANGSGQVNHGVPTVFLDPDVREAERNEATAQTTMTTQLSLVLPDLPNLTELVSGVYQDGTPVFSRHVPGKSHFNSLHQQPYQQPHHGRDGRDHAALKSVPVPSEERVILVSLRILQDKVAELETEKVGSEKRINELQSEVDALRAEKMEKERVRRSDSALGMADSGGDGPEGVIKNRQLKIEITKLQKAVSTLQDRLNRTVQKLSTSEITIRNLTRERDSAVTQLGVAFCTTEDLKGEISFLRKRNEILEHQLVQGAAEREGETQQRVKQEAILRKKLSRNDEAINEIREMTREIRDMKKSEGIISTPQRDQSKKTGDTQASVYRKDDRKAGSLKQGIGAGRADARQAVTKDELNGTAPKPVQPKKRTRMVVIEETIHSDMGASDAASVRSNETNENTHDNDGHSETLKSEDLTYLSFLEEDAVSKLRKTLEAERIKQKSSSTGASTRLRTDRSALQRIDPAESIQNGGVQRKSSLKAPKRVAADKQRETADDGTLGRSSAKSGDNTERLNQVYNVLSKQQVGALPQERRRSTASQSRTPRRRTDMTSAFIIPDITIREPSKQALVQDLEVACTYQCCDGSANHDRRSCTICRRVVSGTEVHLTKETIKITKPIPVSERMPEPAPSDDEPTIRPSQAPSMALATVMKGLEDELAHLKIRLVQHQAAYEQLDASLGKSKRKALCKKTGDLLRAMDVKADQIYSLYDVLEGQKESGQMMNDEHLEMTLHSIGVDLNFYSVGMGPQLATATAAPAPTTAPATTTAAAAAAAATSSVTKKTKTAIVDKDKKDGHDALRPRFIDDGSDDSDLDDLPWEGVDDTD